MGVLSMFVSALPFRVRGYGATSSKEETMLSLVREKYSLFRVFRDSLQVFKRLQSVCVLQHTSTEDVQD